MKKSPFKTSRRVLAKAKLAIIRSDSAKNRLCATAYNTLGRYMFHDKSNSNELSEAIESVPLVP
jgi:hypothetical protein